ncbi:MAG: hypothetical protein GF334_04480 [Candidatus Altiarchaeales archaeon]|nr:hypothetical protein [Candidatus Altiarchaeales archaeon]
MSHVLTTQTKGGILMPRPETTWIETKIGNCKYKSRTRAVKWYLRHSALSQSAIARKVDCSAPLVNQIAQQLKAEGEQRPTKKGRKRSKK